MRKPVKTAVKKSEVRMTGRRASLSATVDTAQHTCQDDGEFKKMVAAMDEFFQLAAEGPLYRVTPKLPPKCKDLFDVYLNAFPEEERQYHNCHACRRFFQNYGNVVYLNTNTLGTHSAFILDFGEPKTYRKPLRAVAAAVKNRPVASIFYTCEKILGLHETGGWSHYALTTPKSAFYAATPSKSLTAKLADKQNNFEALKELYLSVPFSRLREALSVIDIHLPVYAERLRGPLVNVLDLCEEIEIAGKGLNSGRQLINRLWRNVATKPDAFFHIKNSVVGSILQWLGEGVTPAVCARRALPMLHPLNYQRTSEAPKAGTVASAEKLMEQEGIALSLKRRFATADDLEYLWKRPLSQQLDGRPAAKDGLFGSLQTRTPRRLESAPYGFKNDIYGIGTLPKGVTWHAFVKKVLPHAVRIQYKAPARYEKANYCALVTAYTLAAPPILAWDKEDARNPVSWYVWHGGATPEKFNITPLEWVDVTGVCAMPPRWKGREDALYPGGILILQNAHDKLRKTGTALFPEILKPSLRPIRSVIETYGNQDSLVTTPLPPAAGIKVSDGNNVPVRVLFQDGSEQYIFIDRIE